MQRIRSFVQPHVLSDSAPSRQRSALGAVLGHRHVRWLAIVFVIVVAPARVNAEDLRQRLLAEAPPAWEELRAYYTHLDGALTKTENFALHEHPEQNFSKRTQVEFLVNGDLVRGVTSSPTVLTGKPGAEAAPEKAACLNTRYSFLLTRRPSAGEWVIEHMNRNRADIEGEEIRRRAMQNWAEYLWAPWSTGGVSFAELFNKPGFRVESVESTAGASPRITVKFTYAASDEELKQRSRTQPLWALQGGTLVFSPVDQWSLVESEVRGFEGTNEKTTIEYGDRVGKFQIPKRVIRTAIAAQYTYEFSVVVDRITSREAEEEEFTLAAFGLADPSLPEHNRMPTWLWVALLGGALLALGVGFGWMKRRAALKKT